MNIRVTYYKILRRAAIIGVSVIIAGLALVRAESVLALNAVTPVFTRQLGGGNAGYVRHSSPTLADLNGDGRLEIVVGTLQSTEVSSAPYLSVLNYDGTVRWERQVEGHINSSPAVGDINGDGFPEIVVGLGAENEPQLPGGVVAYDRNGNRLWKVTTLDRIGGGSGNSQPNGLADGVFASPSIADVNNDGIPEVIFGSWDMRMYVVKGTDGSPLLGSGSNPYNDWPAEMLDTIWSSPAIADLNGDGKLEFAYGGDISYNPAAGTNNGGLVRVFNHDFVNGPTPFPGFNTLYGTICGGSGCPTNIGHYGKYVDQSLQSSPAIGDINNDGKLETVIGSGRAFDTLTYGHWVKVYDNQGNLLRTLTTDGVVFGSPALADINGDGYLDIIVGTERLNQGNPPPGTLYAWSGRDFSLLWSMAPKNVVGQNLLITSSPIVANIDPANSGPEILFGLGPEITVVSASGQQLTADNTNSTKPTLWVGLSPIGNSPAVADIDGDGNLEIVAAGEYYPITNQVRNYHGWVVAYRWPNAQGNAAGASLPWSMFRRDAVHSGRAGALAPYLSVSPTSINVAHLIGAPGNEQVTLQIRNVGAGSFNWSATAPSGVTLSPSSGSLSTSANSTVTISPSGRSLGTYNLGNIVITATSGGSPVTGSPVSVPVTLRIVSEYFRVFSPLIQK